MKKIELEQIAGDVVELNVKSFINNNFLPYSHYVIRDRALISNDGLKPVNRRLIYYMYSIGAINNKKTKATTIESGTAGHLHPHAVTESLARMGQTFSLRVPLIDVQGSVGFLTGDKPAASRYWEASLSKAGLELVKDIDKDTVQMKPSYANSMQEPIYLPISFPVGIINGTQGIAVGFASNIPPHNPNEVMDACIAKIKGNIKNDEDILKYIQGPDFPTGGELLGIDGVKEYIKNGSGSVEIRGKYKIESLDRGKHRITFFELPYQVSAEQVISAIQLAQEKNKLIDIAEVKDLSGMKDGLKLSITTKAGTNPKLILEDLWKLTPCQSRFSANLVVLINEEPKQVSMMELIDQFIEFRKKCFYNKTCKEISDIGKELSKVQSILSVLVDVDKAIEIIKKSDDTETANQKLQKAFKLSEEQANYILNLQLKTLTKANKSELEFKRNNLTNEFNRLNEIIKNDELFDNAIIEDLKRVKKIISDNRRTSINNITIEDLNEQNKELKKIEKKLSKNADCYITLFENMKVVKTLEQIKNTEEPIKEQIKVKSKDIIFGITKSGVLKSIAVDNIPVDNACKVELLGVNDIINIVNENEVGVLTVSNKGNVNITKGKLKEDKLVNLSDEEFIIFSKTISKKEFENENLALLSEDGYLGYIKVSVIRRANQGSGLIAGMKNDKVVSAALSNNIDELTATSNKCIKKISSKEINATGRGTKGIIFQKLDKDERMTSIYSNTSKITSNNIKILLEVSNRGTKGMKCITDTIKIFRGEFDEIQESDSM